MVVWGKVINLCPESRKDTHGNRFGHEVKLHRRVKKRSEEQILRRYRRQSMEMIIGIALEQNVGNLLETHKLNTRRQIHKYSAGMGNIICARRPLFNLAYNH